MDHDLGKLIEIMRVVGDNRQSCATASEDARRWCNGHDTCNHCRLALIDAIEREIASAKSAAYDAGYDAGFASADDWCAQHEDAMAEHGWYRALCADRKPMFLGDRMEWTNGTFTIHELKFTEGGCTTWDSEHGYTVHAAECRHHHEPTVEDVLREFADAMSETHPLDVPARIAEYAAKLRLAGDAE